MALDGVTCNFVHVNTTRTTPPHPPPPPPPPTHTHSIIVLVPHLTCTLDCLDGDLELMLFILDRVLGESTFCTGVVVRTSASSSFDELSESLEDSESLLESEAGILRPNDPRDLKI